MTASDEGFLYPSIDKDRCVKCNMCENVCPVLNRVREEDEFYRETPKTYAAISLDRKSLENSSSGGVFTALAEETLNRGGYVFGAAFSDDFRKIKHIGVSSVRDLEKLKGSKYLQSDLGDSFSECRRYLEEGKEVLFSGVPCQIAGLKRYLDKDYNGLICIEVICHGTPSEKVWQKYLDHIEAKQGTTKNASFRDKKINWDCFGMRIESVKGDVFSETHQENTYMGVFLRNFALRESCYICPAKGDNTCADMTLGDFWGLHEAYPDYYDEKGVSVVVVHTEKGQKALSDIAGKLILHETDPIKSLKDNWIIYRPVSRPEERDGFYPDLRNRSWRRIVSKYLDNRGMMQRSIDFLRRVKRMVFD